MRLEHRFQAQVSDKTISGAIILILVLFGLTTAGFPQVKLLSLRVHVGEKTPDFSLLSTSGKAVSLSSAYDAATLVLIDTTGPIRWIYQNTNYKIRAPISLELAEARKLQ